MRPGTTTQLVDVGRTEIAGPESVRKKLGVGVTFVTKSSQPGGDV